MKCYEVQKKAVEYLEDMLPENLRSEIRSHLSGCGTCKSHTLRLGSITGDLQRLGSGPLPFDLTREVLRALSGKVPKQAGFFSRKSLAGVLGGIILIAGITAVSFYQKQIKKNMEKPVSAENTHKAASSEDEILLENLKQIDSRLARITGDSSRPVSLEKTADFSVSSLAPLHWHLRFSGVSGRSLFVEKIKRITKKLEFESEYFIAFTLLQENAEKLQRSVSDYPEALVSGPSTDLTNLPSLQLPLRGTFLMEAEGGNFNPPVWKLRFLRRNGFLFIQRLHDADFEFLYESADCLILWVTEEKYKQLQDEMTQMLGLEMIAGDTKAQFADRGTPSVPVIFFFDES